MEDFIAQRDLLITKLGDEAKNYDCVHMMTAAYDPPFKVTPYIMKYFSILSRFNKNFLTR